MDLQESAMNKGDVEIHSKPTYRKFLRDVAKIAKRRKFTLYNSAIAHKAIVLAGEPWICPWLAVVRYGDSISKLTRSENRAIFGAADNKPGHDPAIRRDLLKACGLK